MNPCFFLFLLVFVMHIDQSGGGCGDIQDSEDFLKTLLPKGFMVALERSDPSQNINTIIVRTLQKFCTTMSTVRNVLLSCFEMTCSMGTSPVQMLPAEIEVVSSSDFNCMVLKAIRSKMNSGEASPLPPVSPADCELGKDPPQTVYRYAAISSPTATDSPSSSESTTQPAETEQTTMAAATPPPPPTTTPRTTTATKLQMTSTAEDSTGTLEQIRLSMLFLGLPCFLLLVGIFSWLCLRGRNQGHTYSPGASSENAEPTRTEGMELLQVESPVSHGNVSIIHEHDSLSHTEQGRPCPHSV